MGWVTLDDGQHVYIGSGGEFQPRGPTAPKGPSLREQAAAHRLGSPSDRASHAETLARARRERNKAKALESRLETVKTDPFGKEYRSKPIGVGADAQKRLETLRQRARKDLGYTRGGKVPKPKGNTAPANAKPADQVHQSGPGGLARSTSAATLREKMQTSATAAKGRADAARERGDRPAELKAHEHRALILAKQHGTTGVHKSGQGQVAPGSEKTAAAALVARVRGGGPVKEAATAPAKLAPRSERPNYATPSAKYKAHLMHTDIGTARKEMAAEARHERFRQRAQAANTARGKVIDARNAAERAAAIGPKPGESFSLMQRSATGAKGPVNTGRGTTRFMFDMNKRDLPGQTSMFDKHEAQSPPATRPSTHEAAMQTQRQKLQLKLKQQTTKPGRLF